MTIHLEDHECELEPYDEVTTWLSECDCLECLGVEEEAALDAVRRARDRWAVLQETHSMIQDRIFEVINGCEE